MNASAKYFIQRWAVNTVGVLVAANVVRGIHYDGPLALITASLLLGIFNALVRPVLILFSLPFVLVTFGFFILVINALLLYLVGSLMKSFQVEGFGAAFFGAVIISVISMVANFLLGTNKTRVQLTRRRPPPGPPSGGSGPVIDV